MSSKLVSEVIYLLYYIHILECRKKIPYTTWFFLIFYTTFPQSQTCFVPRRCATPSWQTRVSGTFKLCWQPHAGAYALSCRRRWARAISRLSPILHWRGSELRQEGKAGTVAQWLQPAQQNNASDRVQVCTMGRRRGEKKRSKAWAAYQAHPKERDRRNGRQGSWGGRNNCLLGLPSPQPPPKPTTWGHGLVWPPSSSLSSWSYENNLCVAGSFSAILARLHCFVSLHHAFQSQSQGAFRMSVLLEGNWMVALKLYFGENRFPEPLQCCGALSLQRGQNTIRVKSTCWK